MNNLFLQALKCQKLSRPPIWIMRQAGRYLPEYRALRSQHSFHELIHTPELAARVTQLPIDLLGFDAAILFSDILVITEPFGFAMEFTEKGMQLTAPQKERELPVEKTLRFVPETIRLLKKTLFVPLIGFCGGPYTVCRYMKRITAEWLEKIAIASVEYLKMQMAAGVDAVQIFDSWAGLLPPDQFHTLALPYLKAVVDGIRPLGVPIILFCLGSSRYIPELVSLRPSAIGFDGEMGMEDICQQIPSSIAVQGNLHPDLLQGDPSLLYPAVERLLEEMKNRPGYIFNLGHGILPQTPVENVRWLVRRVQTLKH